MKKCVFNGVATALVTPFKYDGSLDITAYEKLIDEQLRAGVDALVTFGTTGEGSTLSVPEKLELLERSLARAGDKVPIIAATGGNDTLSAAKVSYLASKMGAAAVLVVTPYYNKTGDNGLIRHFFTIADKSEAPVIVYDVPARTGVKISPEVYEKLYSHPNIVASKKADEVSAFLAAKNACGEDFSFYCGCDELFLPFLCCGAKGVISVASNVVPQAIKDIYKRYEKGKTTAALNAHNAVYALIRALFAETNPIPVKYALYKTGLIKNVLRLPLTQASAITERAIDSELKKLAESEKK